MGWGKGGPLGRAVKEFEKKVIRKIFPVNLRNPGGNTVEQAKQAGDELLKHLEKLTEGLAEEGRNLEANVEAMVDRRFNQADQKVDVLRKDLQGFQKRLDNAADQIKSLSEESKAWRAEASDIKQQVAERLNQVENFIENLAAQANILAEIFTASLKSGAGIGFLSSTANNLLKFSGCSVQTAQTVSLFSTAIILSTMLESESLVQLGITVGAAAICKAAAQFYGCSERVSSCLSSALAISISSWRNPIAGTISFFGGAIGSAIGNEASNFLFSFGKGAKND